MADSESERAARARLDSLIPPDIKALAAQGMAAERERQATFDAMGDSELREAAIGSLTAVAGVFARTSLTPVLRERGWTDAEVERLAGYFLELASGIDETGPLGTVVMGKIYDSIGVSVHDDELTTAAYEGTSVYNAYMRRKWPNPRGGRSS